MTIRGDLHTIVSDALYHYEAIDFGERAGYTKRDIDAVSSIIVEALESRIAAETDALNLAIGWWAEKWLTTQTEVGTLTAERDATRGTLARVIDTHDLYFDRSRPPIDACPEPEDVWRYERDFRTAVNPEDTDA